MLDKNIFSIKFIEVDDNFQDENFTELEKIFKNLEGKKYSIIH